MGTELVTYNVNDVDIVVIVHILTPFIHAKEKTYYKLINTTGQMNTIEVMWTFYGKYWRTIILIRKKNKF